MRAATGAWVLAAGALACHGAGVSVTLRPGFDGLFRPGAPVWLRGTVANDGAVFEGTLDLTVEGVVYRQAVRVGAHAVGLVDALVAARSAGARARVVLRGSEGQVVHESDAALGFRQAPEGALLVVAAAAPQGAAVDLFGTCGAVAGADELPPLAAGYAALDALALAGDGGEVPTAARPAIADWVRGGGVAAFALDGQAPVRSDSLLAELGGCGGRASAAEWLAVVAERQHAREAAGGRVWHVGLGTVCAGVRTGLARGALAGLARADAAARDDWTDPGLYAAFRGARWEAAARWRLVGGAAALLAAGVLVARFAWRGRGRAARAALAVGAAAGLAAVAWAVMLPAGHGTLEAACVAERVAGQAGERRTEVVCVEAVGRSRVRLDFGAAEAVVPFCRSAEDAGGGGAVIERDATGRWAAACALTGRTRCCFAAWWPWQERAEAAAGARPGGVVVRGGRFALAEEQGKLPAEPWRPLDGLREWGDADRALAAWQARRAGAGQALYVRQDASPAPAVTGQGILWRHVLAAQVWTRLTE